MKNEDIYSMKLFETVCVGIRSHFVRVPGGWVYKDMEAHEGGSRVVSSVFIPYDMEFTSKVRQVSLGGKSHARSRV